MKKERIDLIIFHYHLLPGGVTDVIRHSLSALNSSHEIQSITVVCGRDQNTDRMQDHINKLKRFGAAIPVNMKVMPELDYLSNQEEPPSPGKIKNQLLDEFGSPASVWLIHNYHLGKNWAFTSALNSIARDENQRLIYQIHDYPECARYGNLNELNSHIDGSLYPVTPTLRYCVINVRDYEIMKKSGLPEGIIHLLENPVPAGDNPAGHPVDKKELKKKLTAYAPVDGRFDPDGDIWLYPVRSIRRKNVLEGGLICSLIEDPVNLILTLPGVSPQEKSYSDLCEKAFASGLIRGFWGTGSLPDVAGISYEDMISGSDLIYSSSVQEGFGYMYLNALVWQKPLLARHLDIMGGFSSLMKGYPAYLYDSVRIPADSGLKKKMGKEYTQRFEALGNLLPSGLKQILLEELKKLLSQNSVEFSYLSPADQYSFLETVSSPLMQSECRDLNRELMGKIRELRSFSPVSREDRLYETYGAAAYRDAFSRILTSFDQPGLNEDMSDFNEDSVDKSLQNEFTRLEFLRLLYL